MKVLAVGPDSLWVRPFTAPPRFRWSMEPTIPILSTETDNPTADADVLEVAREEFEAWLPHHVVPEGTSTAEREALDRVMLAITPAIPPELMQQLERIEATTDAWLQYRPCTVVLRSGRTLDCVYLVEADPYIRMWGIWPQHDSGKQMVAITDVVEIRESPKRLPASVANKMYRAGESAMGGCFFTLLLEDGRRVPCATGNAVDFVDLPDGVAPGQVIDLIPHEGREFLSPTTSRPLGVLEPARGLDYWWCLYRLPRRR